MRTVAEHLAAILAAARPVAPLDVVLADADGCILAEDVTAPRDVPMWTVAGCDGYAVRSVDVGAPGPGPAPEVTLPVAADAPVTAAAPLRLVPGTAVLIAAGGPLPVGADAVVPMERTDRGRARVVVRGGAEAGEHLRPAGADLGAGDAVLTTGTRLAARHLAVAAALGRGRLRVHPAPRVIVVSVGDELVEPGRARPDGRVHDVDGPALAAAVKEAGASAVRVGPVGDDRAALREILADQLVRADLIILTGGLSHGPWDTVTDVLAPLGTVRFDQIAMTPGHRQGFGTVRAEGDDAHDADGRPGGVPVFALPGHPVAAQVSYEVFVRPALRAMAGYVDLYRPTVRAASARPWASPAGRRQFVPATVTGSPTDGYVVTPVGDPSRVSLGALGLANALVVVGEDTTRVRAGDTLACLVLDG
ncbi:gephyrin-like molybdotransferase Glp [Actinotalea sp.]|uniref:molybdopterin molybdotransferase MoeA n=1 Tax=Actinotalea sp. TaxID=1872145 RepID=UPI002C225E27|nr:gephyrin-like molybdotransferase Glp [Actinotalea sp.]HQY33235.1 molybdopterin molybdotransferase MoeA [Actinotalea sp.]HRA50379.1 molybdopterin molybdotransferase MoeA [Actinotalea sp.]